jgi:apolipoprotein N-acyltransferase
VASLSRILRPWPWLAAICTGFLYAACFPPFDQEWLCWIALTPLLAAIWFSNQDSKRQWLRNLSLGYLAGVSFFWTTFFWLRTVTLPGMILVGAYMAIYIALWSWICGLLRPKLRPPRPASRWNLQRSKPQLATADSTEGNESPLRRSPWLSSTNNLRLAFLLASVWVAQEWLRSVVLSGWGWNTLGTALHSQVAMIQITEYTGVAGLSFLVAFTNVILLSTTQRFILEAQVKPMRPHYDLTITMAAIIGVLGFGFRAFQIRPPTNTLNVVLVQPNIPREQKFTTQFAQATFDQFTRLSSKGFDPSSPPDLIVWPESSMPGPVLQDEPSYRYVMDFSTSTMTDLLLGTIDLAEKADYNAALLVSESGERIQIYRKVHLVPFGEYVPGRHIVPFIAQIVGDQVPSDFSFGKDFTVFRLSNDKARVAPLICFEDTIGDLTRQFVLNGANLLANVTNDGWFLRSAGSRQHLANAVFRCVETRLPMVRAANTGVTCMISEFGVIAPNRILPPFVDDVLTGEVKVPSERELTFYVRHGELVAHASTGISLVILIFVGLGWVRRKRTPLPEEAA